MAAKRRSVRGEWLAYYLAELDPDNPQIRRFAKRLALKRVEASGIYGAVLGFMWKHQRDGDLQAVDADDLEYAAEWKGTPGAMYQAFLEIFNDLLWEQTWEERTRFHRMPEVARDQETARKAAYRAKKGEPDGEPLEQSDAKPSDAKPDLSQTLSQSCPNHQPTNRPTDKPTDKKTHLPNAAGPPWQIRDVDITVGSVGGSFSKQPEGKRHPAFAALERCALSLSLAPPAAVKFAAYVESKVDARGVRSCLIDDNLALLMYAAERDRELKTAGKPGVCDFTAYVDGCSFHARDRWGKKARALFAREFGKEAT